MFVSVRIVLASAIFAVCSPGIATGQDTSNANLLRRVEQLEQANAQLERRIRELDTRIKSAPLPTQPTPTSNKWRELSNWRRLRLGMNMEEVRAVLGEPERVEAGFFTFWHWSDGQVSFKSGKVDAGQSQRFRPLRLLRRHARTQQCLPHARHNERCCIQRRCGALCNCAALRATPFTADLFEPLQQTALFRTK